MPKKLLLISFLLLFLNLFLVKNISFAQTPTSPKSIKFGYFTPPPTRTPTQTPIPLPTDPAGPTPTGPTPTGPTPTDEPDGNKIPEVIDLVNQIRQHCTNGVIYDGNIDCIDKLVLPRAVEAEVKSELKFSVTWNNFLQCVGFVRASTARKYGTAVDKGGDAINFSTNVPTGYIFIDKNSGVKIKINDLAIWDYDTWGHIAYVIQVNSSNVFQVAEANFSSNGKVEITSKTVDSPNLIGWIRRV
ncbi:hypothetical protein A2W14_07040 [Candidatus Gottesmanbacteria bacterium RBG_16_37_8]|uniref:Peptidase C51 domain-containing protein n=1 Tax=Candidatus Gottesmanbacteria bacterium RBG_16_37_8 TaxID=1798371 RepID=A0A1F5YSS1_9BACT|nr:MAG: hypothetical protein A2W14_07040 [Candidatus Gottesmanbacteria bacterium RBG_16_37_8]